MQAMMATKARILAVAVLAFNHAHFNEAFTLVSRADAELQAEALSYHHERLRHHASLINKTKHMTLDRALSVLKDGSAPPDLVKFIHKKLHQQSAHHRLRRGQHAVRNQEEAPPSDDEETYGQGVVRAKDMLNDMIYEVQTQYEIEHHKCCDYEHTKNALIENAAQDIALFNAESAQARAEILDATSQIGICEKRIPKLRDSLSEHNRKCTAEIQGLQTELDNIAADKGVMESISDSADCAKLAAEAAAAAGGHSLIQCVNPCTQEPHMLFANKTVRQLMQKLKSDTVQQLVQHHLSKVHKHSKHHFVGALLQEQLETEMVTGFNAKLNEQLNSTQAPMGAKPPGPCKKPAPTDLRSSKCAMGPGNCEIIAERLLTIHAKIIDKKTDLEEEISKLKKTCDEVKKSFESQIHDFETQLVQEQAKLAASTKVQNTADEQNRLKTIEKEDMQKEFREMTETCHKNYQSFEDQECGLKKIRGELFRMKAPEAAGVFEDCQLSEWSLGECSASCQGGTQTLSRTIITAPKGGVKCLPLKRVQPCNTQKCSIDCKVADWQSWSGCTADCGGGIMQRGRAVNVKAKYGGKPCGETSEVRSCNQQSCNADCTLGAWTAWSGCSKACGGGRQRRLKFIEEAARGTGKCPKEKDESRLEYQECNTKACSPGLACQSDLDVVLLLDGSSRVGDDGWEAVKTAGQYLVTALGSSGRVKLSVILFAGPKTLHGLSVCTNEDPTAPPPDMAKDCSVQVISKLTSNSAELLAKVKELKYPKGSALTSAALSAAEAELALGRKDANSVVLVLTRGKPLSEDKTTLMAKRLKKKARVMWVPVVGFESLDVFQLWSSDPDDENVIPMKDWAQLKDPKTTDEIIAYMCPSISSKAFIPTPTHEWVFRSCSGPVKDGQSELLAKPSGGAQCRVDGIHFNGDKQFVTYDSFPLGGTFAVEVYVKLSAFSSWSRIFDFGDGPGENDLLLSHEGTSNTAWVEVNRGGVAKQQLKSPDFWQLDQWQHVVVTAGNGAVKLYKNGKLAVQKGGITDAQLLTRARMFSGKSQYVADGFLQGTLSALRVWNGVALSDEIIESMFKTEVSYCAKSSVGQSASDTGCPMIRATSGVKLEKCEDFCRETEGCTGFDFHAESGGCYIRDCPDPMRPFLDSNPGYQYFGLCKAPTPFCRVTNMHTGSSDGALARFDWVSFDRCAAECLKKDGCTGFDYYISRACTLRQVPDPKKPDTVELEDAAFYGLC